MEITSPKDFQSFLTKIETCFNGLPGQKDSRSTKATPEGMHGSRTTETRIAVRQLQQSFTDLPQLRNQIASPQTEEHKTFSKRFCTILTKMMGRYFYDYYVTDILKAGHISLDRLKKLHHIDRYSDPSGDYTEFLNDLCDISQREKQLLRTDSSHFERVFGFMDAQNQRLVRNAIAPTNAQIDIASAPHRDGYDAQGIKNTQT